MRSLLMVLLLLLVFSVPLQAVDETTLNGPPPGFDVHPDPDQVYDWNRLVLFNNGPVYNCENCGGAGVHWSVLQDLTWFENTYGFGTQISANNKMADDFIVPAGETWQITGVTFFVYQTGSGLQSTINDVRLVMYGAMPGDINTNIIYGDWNTNVLAATSWASVYRTLESAGGGTTRPIMAVTAEADVILGPGQYWLGATFGGTLSSGPWAPPVPIINNCDTGDAMQSVAGAAFVTVFDSGSGCMKGLPFIIEGDFVTPADESSWGGIKALYR